MDPDPDLSIILLGKAGAGKSASGNTILGRTVFKSKLSFRPVTKSITEETGRVFEKQIRVIDTPGILDKEDTEQVLKSYCEKILESNRPVLFLVVIRIGRLTNEEKEALEAAQRVLGPQGLKKSYLLFTGGEFLKGMTLTNFIFEENEDYLTDVVKKFVGAYHLFNNEDEDEEQVRSLLLKAGYLRPNVEPDVQEERRIVLLGRNGSGKSSSGNTVLGSEMFESGCSFDSVTTETVFRSDIVEDRQVTVVDTPGFTEEHLTPEQMCEAISRMIVEAKPGPHAFVIVVRLGRVSKADMKMFEIMEKLFGSDAFKYTMVLFTGGDELRGWSIVQMIQSNSSMSDLVSMCGGRYCVFENNRRGNRNQVREFLRKIDEMVTDNGGTHYTSVMFKMVETFIREERILEEEARLKTEEKKREEEARLMREERNLEEEAKKSDASSSGRDNKTPGDNVNDKVLKRLLPFVKNCLGKHSVVGGVLGGVLGGVAGGTVGRAVGRAVGVVVGNVVGAAVGELYHRASDK